MTDRELMQQALDALQEYVGVVVSVNDPNDWTPKVADAGEPARKAIEALRARLAQPEPEPEKSQDKPCVEDDGCPTEKAVLQRFWREHQAQPEPEPVAWMHPTSRDCVSTQSYSYKDAIPLYTAPPQRVWQGLTDEEIKAVRVACGNPLALHIEFARAIEAKLREKNGNF